jgi:hypothetical protein
MNVGDERSRSLWMDVEVAPGTSKLTRDAECDTVVIGSGIAGLSTAYELSGQGQKVIAEWPAIFPLQKAEVDSEEVRPKASRMR